MGNSIFLAILFVLLIAAAYLLHFGPFAVAQIAPGSASIYLLAYEPAYPQVAPNATITYSWQPESNSTSATQSSCQTTQQAPTFAGGKVLAEPLQPIPALTGIVAYCRLPLTSNNGMFTGALVAQATAAGFKSDTVGVALSVSSNDTVILALPLVVTNHTSTVNLSPYITVQPAPTKQNPNWLDAAVNFIMKR